MSKKQIRSGVFETNSSSTHSMTVRWKNNIEPSTLVVADDGYVHVEFGEFGWGYDRLRSQEEKLSYLCTTMICSVGDDVQSKEDVYKSEPFLAINNVIRERCNCNGLRIDTEISLHRPPVGRPYLEYDGYIDHQSLSTLQGLLDDYDVTIEQVIFCPGVSIIIDNDNH